MVSKQRGLGQGVQQRGLNQGVQQSGLGQGVQKIRINQLNTNSMAIFIVN